MYKVKLILTVFILTIAGTASADHLKSHKVEDRIKPAGSVYVDGDDVPVSKPAVVASTGPRSGESIYKEKCSSCHATDAIGAPMFGNVDSWKGRIAKGEQALFDSAINGLNGMPAMGLCSDCSQDEIKETVKYMVANSQ